MAKREEAAKAAAEVREESPSAKAAVFSKKQLMKSEKFTAVRDLLDALLLPEERLTVRQAEARIQAFLTKEAL